MTPRRTPRTHSRWRDDGGSAVSELVVLTVVSFLFVAVVVFAGRVTVGRAHTAAAARSAARTISVSRDPRAAAVEAEEGARRIVAEGSVTCADMRFDAKIEAERVTVTVACSVDLSQATLAEVPGTMEVRATVAESIDLYRERA